MQIVEYVGRKQPRIALDIIAIWNLRSLAVMLGIEPVELQDYQTEVLMSAGRYRRVRGGALRQIHPGAGRVIA